MEITLAALALLQTVQDLADRFGSFVCAACFSQIFLVNFDQRAQMLTEYMAIMIFVLPDAVSRSNR